ncbi:hypothetical protein RHODO2019_18910 (plasmid) [Rhodococcus antarcticus]|uniref:Excreted virulence factor EspC (Type VII ESX diderm) n=1 Tax=Rhodococcus antarcticus TaxID=2987751 RepID=A0ABY6P616_9NOCA|nr:hypothetical protein [Rhodococcus antarcticus]UZJ26958.1 hypothetical protein RHODO2019_18910 [Rhodococcus antarcticus]
MTQTEQQTTGKAAAAAAAKKMLVVRIALVTTLGDAIGNYRRAGDAVATAKSAQETAARTARAAAMAGGWTAAELPDAGLVVPAEPRRRNSPSSAESTVVEHDLGSQE